ncbi:MAG: single-stranded DNA-binding protein [Gammaproteobacteria bacterium]
MSSSINILTISGNLGRDPEMNYNPSGNPYTRFSVAVSQWDFKSKSETTMWIPVFVSGKRAETCAQWLQSGSKVIVSGNLQEREYTDKDNIVRKAYSLMAQEVVFVGKLKSGGQTPEPDEVPDDVHPF